MRPYADTNLLSRFYLRLSESEAIASWLAKGQALESAPWPVTWLHRIETLNAFQLYIFAAKMGGQIRVTPEQAAAAHASFQTDLAQGTFLRPAQIEFPRLESQFDELSLRHTAKYGFRTYDLLHVTSALILACDACWSLDPKASRLAALEELRVR